MEKIPNFLTSFLALQTENFLIDFRDHMDDCIIAATPKKLKHCATQNNWRISKLENTRVSSAIVIKKPYSDHELWVRSHYTNYRAAFQKFLDIYYPKYNIKIPHNFQVDHLYPSSGFDKNKGIYFIRLALIYRAINSSYGTCFEKNLYKREREREVQQKEVLHMDWITLLKAYNIPLVKKSLGQDNWKDWSWSISKQFARECFDPVLTYIGITTMLNLSFRDKWQPFSPNKNFIEEFKSYDSYSCIPNIMDYD